MRRILKVALLVAGGLGVAFPAAAQQKKVDFDNGKDDTGIIEQVKKEGSLRYANPLRTLDAPRALPKGLTPATKRTVHQRSAHVGSGNRSSVRLHRLPETVGAPQGPIPERSGGGSRSGPEPLGARGGFQIPRGRPGPVSFVLATRASASRVMASSELLSSAALRRRSSSGPTRMGSP